MISFASGTKSITTPVGRVFDNALYRSLTFNFALLVDRGTGVGSRHQLPPLVKTRQASSLLLVSGSYIKLRTYYLLTRKLFEELKSLVGCTRLPRFHLSISPALRPLWEFERRLGELDRNIVPRKMLRSFELFN